MYRGTTFLYWPRIVPRWWISSPLPNSTTPVGAWFYRNMNGILYDRSSPDPRAVRGVLERLRRGRLVAIFPEGKLCEYAHSVFTDLPLRPGMCRLAIAAQAPILPVVLLNTDVYCRVRAWMPTRGTRYGIYFIGPLLPPPVLPRQSRPRGCHSAIRSRLPIPHAGPAKDLARSPAAPTGRPERGRHSMSDMRQEIRLCRTEVGAQSGLPWARYRFPIAFSGFAGHFPGQPVLPGVCMLKAAAVTLEDWHGFAIKAIEVRKARFLSPIDPGQTLEIKCVRHSTEPEGFTAQLTLRGEGDRKTSECFFRYR
jgi:hypothetical protein